MLKLYFALESKTLLRAEVVVQQPDGNVRTLRTQFNRIDMGLMLQKVIARGYQIHGQSFLSFGKKGEMLLEVVLSKPDADGIPF